jgi:hypothetical protein
MTIRGKHDYPAILLKVAAAVLVFGQARPSLWIPFVRLAPLVAIRYVLAFPDAHVLRHSYIQNSNVKILFGTHKLNM